jgi:hypothetical protein
MIQWEEVNHPATVAPAEAIGARHVGNPTGRFFGMSWLRMGLNKETEAPECV